MHLLIDEGTEELAFTGCTFQDCNVDRIEQDERRRIISKGNLFDRPLDEKRKEFDGQQLSGIGTSDNSLIRSADARSADSMAPEVS